MPVLSVAGDVERAAQRAVLRLRRNVMRAAARNIGRDEANPAGRLVWRRPQGTLSTGPRWKRLTHYDLQSVPVQVPVDDGYHERPTGRRRTSTSPSGSHGTRAR